MPAPAGADEDTLHENIVDVKEVQVGPFEARLEDNHRPVQPRGSHPVVLVTAP